MRPNTRCETTIIGYQRRGSTRRLQRLAQRNRNSLRFMGGGGERCEADALQRPLRLR